MKSIPKSKPTLFAILILSVILSFSLASASVINPPTISEHRQIMFQYISELRLIENRIFQLAQLSIECPARPLTDLSNNIQSIDRAISNLRRRISEYTDVISSISPQNRDVLLLTNALNYNRNALYQLSAVAQTTNNLERLIFLGDFFRARISSYETLNALDTILQNY